MILKISLRAKARVPATLVKRKLHLHSLYFPQNTLMLTESRGEFSDLLSCLASCASLSNRKAVSAHLNLYASATRKIIRCVKLEKEKSSRSKGNMLAGSYK